MTIAQSGSNQALQTSRLMSLRSAHGGMTHGLGRVNSGASRSCLPLALDPWTGPPAGPLPTDVLGRRLWRMRRVRSFPPLAHEMRPMHGCSAQVQVNPWVQMRMPGGLQPAPRLTWKKRRLVRAPDDKEETRVVASAASWSEFPVRPNFAKTETRHTEPVACQWRGVIATVLLLFGSSGGRDAEDCEFLTPSGTREGQFAALHTQQSRHRTLLYPWPAWRSFDLL